MTALFALGLGTAAFGLIFQDEIAVAIQVWVNSDAYNHCFLVIPAAAYLAWERRDALGRIVVRPAPRIAFLAIPVAAAWFVADRLGVMEARQLTAMTLFQIMVASLLGPGVWRAFACPLLYLFFLVPFGEFVVPPLQKLAVHFTTNGLNLLGINNFSDGVTIEIPEGTFVVHQACSGLRFLIASLAFGALYACVMFTSWVRRILFIALSIVVAVIANCFRVLGIIVIAHFLGNAQAVDAGHVLWGWGFYVIVGAVLILIGLAFRQDAHPFFRQRPPRSAPSMAASLVALASVILITTAPRLAANYFDHLGVEKSSAVPLLMPSLPGCMPVPVPDLLPTPSSEGGADPSSSQSAGYQCGSDVFVLTLKRYPPRIGVRPLFASLRNAMSGFADIIVQGDFAAGRGAEPLLWHVTEGSTDRSYVALATALWLDGRPSGVGIGARIQQALNSTRSSPRPPVLAIVSHSNSTLTGAQHAIEGFLPKTGPLFDVIGRWLATTTAR